MSDQLPDPGLTRIYRLEATVGQPLTSERPPRGTAAPCP
jgi:hypothetical protein